jgi:hypothetical protein
MGRGEPQKLLKLSVFSFQFSCGYINSKNLKFLSEKSELYQQVDIHEIKVATKKFSKFVIFLKIMTQSRLKLWLLTSLKAYNLIKLK